VQFSGGSAFSAVKYLTYSLLLVNVFLFLGEELRSLEHTFVEGITLGQFVQVFAATIDTAAWVVLLLLFELETSVLEDRRIRGGVKLALHGIRGICYVAIVYAFAGYCAELLTLYRSVPMAGGWEACGDLQAGWSVILTLDKYLPLDATNCATLGPGTERLEGFAILASAEVLGAVRWLAWTDVINAGAWILVVIVLEVEVRLQLKRQLTDRVVRGTGIAKYVLYTTLFVCAVYWGFRGDFLDFWDAGLWLFAFIFIELNVFDWQRETRDVAAVTAAPGD
jgi:hypothetical protein